MRPQAQIGVTATAAIHDRFISRREAAEMLGLAVSTLAAWASRHDETAPPMRKHGRRALYSEQELREWSEQRRVVVQ